MDTMERLRTALWGAWLVAWCSGGALQGHAQADAWVTSTAASGGSGNWTDLVNPAITASALPSPGGALGYNGAAPLYSHHARTNGAGQLDFFEVDGNLYDGDGYLIADARGAGCQECIGKGVMEFVSVPVPGYCGLYYLFTAEAKTQVFSNSYVQVSLLDMERSNPRFTGQGNCSERKGTLVNLYDQEIEDHYPGISQWLWGEDYFVEPNANTSDYVAILPTDNIGKSQSPMIRVATGIGPDAPTFLFTIMTTRIYIYAIRSTGIQRISPVGGLGHMPLYGGEEVFTSKQYYRDVDVRRTGNSELQLFMTSGSDLNAYPFDQQIEPQYNTLSMRFNAQTGALVQGSVQGFAIAPPLLGCNSAPSGGGVGGPAGCALDLSGDGAWILAEGTTDCTNWLPKLLHLDFSSEVITDVTSQVPGIASLVRSRMYRNAYPDPSLERICIPHAQGIASMLNLDTPTALTYTFNAFSQAFPPVHAGPPGQPSTNFQPRFLNPSVEKDGHLTEFNRQACCTYFETVPGATVEGYTQVAGTTTTWNGTQNSVQPGTSTVVFTCDVVVEPGARLVVNNMNWKFAADARVIVQEGGYLQMNNATLDAITCPGDRWPGIAVLGNPLQSQQGQAPWSVPADQGMVQLTNCTVSNAHIGILTGDAQVGFNGSLYNISNSQGGAVVLANGCTLRNCITAVDMRKYPSVVPQGQPLPLNRSRFNGTTFVVDEPLTDQPFNFKRHVRLDRVSGVIFRKCHFQNLVNDAEYATLGSAALGYGIESYESQFQVLPSCSILLNAGEECPTGNTVPCTFTGLDHGIHAIGGPNALRNFTVDAARFTDNICGVYTSGVIGFVAKRSNFEIGGRGVPLTNLPFEEYWQGYHRGVYSYNGYGFTVQDNTLSRSVNAGNDIRTEGVVIGYSKDHNDVVFRNTGANLLRGFVGEGVCASLAPSYTPVIGLQLKCNINQNNEWNLVSRKANDEDGNLQSLHTIRANQGESNLPMDNQFDGWDGTNDKWDFRVTTTYTPISYWHRNSGVDPFVPQVSSDPVIAAQNFLMNPQQVIVTPTNTCNKRIQRLPGLSDGLSPGEVKEFIETEKIAYGTTRYLYDQLIDGGSTDEVVQEITDAWPQDAWDLRAYLMSKSPYLSTSVLKDLNVQNKLPQAMYVEVCAANPDATKADGFTAWLKSEAPYPLPDYMVATIEDSWDVRTYRTNLELTMADRHASMSQAGNLLIEVYSGDTVYDPQDSLRMLWQEIRTPAARYAEAIAWMQRGEFDFARNLVAGIPQEHTKLREKELSEKDRMLALIDLLKAFDQADRELDALTLAEQDQLESISQGSSDRAATWAQNLLCFHYERCAAPYTGEAGDGGPKARALVNEVEPSDVAILTMSPNPTANWSAVNIVLPSADDHASLLVLDLSGKVVQRHRVAHATQQVVLDTRGLAPGAYLVELRSDNASLAQEKLIVQP